MTACAAIRNVLMASGQKNRRGKDVGRIVTDTAIFLSWYVISYFRRRDTRAVAGCAIIGINTQVIKCDTCKCNEVINGVTIGAIEHRWYMINRLAKTDITVVTLAAIVRIYATMIKRCIGKVSRIVAVNTILCIRVSWNVVGRFTCTNHIVVAGCTSIYNTSMIECASDKSPGGVTGTAIFDSRHVVQ